MELLFSVKKSVFKKVFLATGSEKWYAMEVLCLNSWNG